MGKLAVSVAEAAAMLGVCENTARAYFRDGQLRGRKIRGRILIPVAAVHELLGNAPEPGKDWDLVLLGEK